LIVVIAAIKLTRIIPSLSAKWYITPAILLAAALIPTLIKKQNPLKTLLPLKNIRLSLTLLSLTCVIVFPLLYITLFTLKRFPVIVMPVMIPPPDGQVANWLIYQFLYIAVFEELFFRAYLQSNILTAMDQQPAKKLTRRHWTAITISSAAFTAAHIIINADPMAILVFLPAIIFGWLYAKTNSLIAPILFHGISNTIYYYMSYLL
jgi:membrane protease YdiL (CAAX protease family)